MSKLRVGRMGKVTAGLVIVVVLVLLGGMAFLAFWNPPAPSAPGEKALPAAGFPKQPSVPGVALRTPIEIPRQLEAFLEMLAAERGAMPLTLAAYRNDLAD